MRALLVVVALLLAAPVLANDPRIAEGVALHDAGKYDEAIARYKAVLADDPSNVLASYELGLTYQMKRDHARCLALLEPLAEQPGPLQVPILTTIGSCRNIGGDAAGAVATYRKALAISPDDAMLLYNFAVALVGQEQLSEARELLKRELKIRPGHGSGRYALARVFDAEGFRVPAVLEYLRFLSIEPSTARSRDAAERLVTLLNLGVEAKSRKNIQITIDPDTPTAEGDFGTAEVMLALAAGVRLGENRRKSQFDAMREQVVAAVTMLVESRADAGTNYTAEQNLPFFAAMLEKGLLEPFAGVALGPLGLKGGDKWLKKNQAAVASLNAFLSAQPR